MKRIRFLLVALCLLVSAAVHAMEVTVNGINYEISSDGQATIVRNNNTSGALIIPKRISIDGTYYSVTSIGEGAFKGCSSLTSVDIPNSVISIGEEAFYGCSSLTSIIIPNRVTIIQPAIFVNCSSLKSVVIPNSVTNIGDHAFAGCSSLTSIDIPNSVTNIDYMTFFRCSSLTSIDIPDGVTNIGDYAFWSCSSLKSVIIPNSVTNIGNHAFGSCSSLKSVVIPNSVTNIGTSTFNGCSSLTSVNIPNSVTNIGTIAFYGCSSLTSVDIPNSVTNIGEGAFNGCTSLTSVDIPDGVTSIKKQTFFNCKNLSSISIPNSVTSIGENAFYLCKKLTSVVIPNGVDSIGIYAFYGCENLTSLYISNSVTSISFTAFIMCGNNLSQIIVEEGNPVYDSRNNCNAIIRTADNTLILGCNSTIIPGNIKSIEKKAFEERNHLTTIDIPNSVTSIGREAFSSCDNLTSIVLPNSVTYIGSAAFWNCKNLTSIVIPNNVDTIGGTVFKYCSNLADVTNLSETPQYIDSSTFSNYGTLHVLPGCKEAYSKADVWSSFNIVEDASTTINLTNKYMTYCNPYILDFSNQTDISAYVVVGYHDKKVTLAKVTKVPAGEGVIIKGTPGTYKVNYGTTASYYANMLKGVTGATTINPTEGKYTNFILANDPEDGIGFYKVSTSGELAAGKAYLQIPNYAVSSMAKGFSLFFEDETTGIKQIDEKNANTEVYYNLQGVKVNKPTQKGIYIINGKKYIKK